MINAFDDNYYMRQAYLLAELAEQEGEVPVGAIIVQNNQIIAKAYNQVEKLADATAHAEMLAITSAMDFLGSKYLKDCILYVTLEPCLMCSGAIDHAQIKKLVYGASDKKKGVSVYTPAVLGNKVEIIGAVMEQECSDILTNFFKKKR